MEWFHFAVAAVPLFIQLVLAVFRICQLETPTTDESIESSGILSRLLTAEGTKPLDRNLTRNIRELIKDYGLTVGDLGILSDGLRAVLISALLVFVQALVELDSSESPVRPVLVPAGVLLAMILVLTLSAPVIVNRRIRLAAERGDFNVGTILTYLRNCNLLLTERAIRMDAVSDRGVFWLRVTEFQMWAVYLPLLSAGIFAGYYIIF